LKKKKNTLKKKKNKFFKNQRIIKVN